MKAILLAGGKGRRLLPYTTVLPKPLMPIGDMPILEILIRQLKEYGITEVVISVGHLANLIQAFFGNGERWGINIKYSIENKPLGTAGPLKLIEDLDETFMVMNGDVLTTLDFLKLLDHHKDTGSRLTVAAFERDSKIDFGVLKFKDNDIIDFIEKPVYHFDVSMGIYCLEPDVLNYIKDGEKIDVPEVILRLLKDNKKVSGYKEDCMWLDIGRLDDYENAIELFENNKKMFLRNNNGLESTV